MKVLLLSCRHFETKIRGLATRPFGVDPESVTSRIYTADKSIVALITVESGDAAKPAVQELSSELRKFSADTGIKTLVIFPFSHLSNRLASSGEALPVLNSLVETLNDFSPIRIHYGSHKSLLLDIHGHKGNVRWREF